MKGSRPMSHGKALLLTAVLVLGSCGTKNQNTKHAFQMGEKMQVGPFIYNVLETKWVPQLGDMFSQRIPTQRFLLVHLTVTNSGGKEAAIPLLKVENRQGQEFQEDQNGQGVDGWLGLLRNLAPAATEEGWILFDVPPNSYSLRCSAGGDLENEQSLLIELPYNMDSAHETMPATPSQP